MKDVVTNPERGVASHALAWGAYVGGTTAMIYGLRLSYAYSKAFTAAELNHKFIVLIVMVTAFALLTFSLAHLCRQTKSPHIILGMCLGAQELLCALLLAGLIIHAITS